MACDKIAGYHKLYWAAQGDAMSSAGYLGTTGPEGITLNREVFVESITSDELGPEAIIDGVYQGANLTLEFVLQDIDKDIVQQFLHPWQTTTGATPTTTQEDVGIGGQLACGKAGLLEAIPITGSPAATAGGGSMTSGTNGRQFVGISMGPIVESLDNRPRFVPARFQVFPYDTGSKLVYWNWISAVSANTLTDGVIA